MIYIKRVANADVTRQIDLNNEAARQFFGFISDNEDSKNLQFEEENSGRVINGTIKKSGHGNTITGQIFSVVSHSCSQNDLLVFKTVDRSPNKFRYLIIKQSDSQYHQFNHSLELFGSHHGGLNTTTHLILDFEDSEEGAVEPTTENVLLETQEYAYISAIKTKPFLILGGFSGTGKSQKVKELAFATCPCDGVLNVSETSPGNYLLVSVKPNWHDATDITGFRSSVNRNYYVTDFMRFLVKAKLYETKKIPFFVCLDEMNLAPVEEYFADFLSVIESRKKKSDGRIVTDSIVPASVFNDKDYAEDFNIFLKLGLSPKIEVKDITDFSARIKEKGNESDFFVESWLVEELKRNGLTIPSNLVIIGTVNMDDTTNSFSRKVIDRAMTFETVVEEFGEDYFAGDVPLNYVKTPRNGELFISDEVRATQMLEEGRFELTVDEQKEILAFINNINNDLEGSPFKISYRILNETILLYRSKKKIVELMAEGGGFEKGVIFKTDLNSIFDDILMQKVLPRIEGDYEKCSTCLNKLLSRAEDKEWHKSFEKIEFMIKRFGTDKSGFTTFWN